MKEAELRAAATCALCRKPFGHTGLPLFWRVTIERFGVDVRATRRQDGLAQMLGNTALASVMGPGEEMAGLIAEPTTITVCEECAITKSHCVAMMAEVGATDEVAA